MRIRESMRLVTRALLLVGVLFGMLGGVMPPPAAHAARDVDDEPCLPQTVTAADAELAGTLRLLDPAMVGQATRVSMAGAQLRLPNPRCDGEYINVPFGYNWAIIARPSGSTATLASTTSLTTSLVPDRAGTWQVRFTACPSGCRVTGTTITIPALTRTLNFTAVRVVEGRLSGVELEGTLKFLLAGTRIQLSHTGAGGSVPVQYSLRWTIPFRKYQDLCLNVQPPAEPAPICAYWEEEGLSGEVVYHTYTSQFTSFIDFGLPAEQAGAPGSILLPIAPFERAVPLQYRAALVALQPASIITSADVDRVRLLANNINLDLGKLQKWSVTIGGGSINLAMSLESSHPSFVCEGHYTQKTGYVLSTSEGWSDELCPDFDLSKIDLSVRLFPGVANGLLTVADAQTAAQLVPQGVTSELIDLLFDATDKAETEFATMLREKLLAPQTRTDVGEVLTQVVKNKFPDLVRVVSAQIVGADLVVRYECADPGRPGGLTSLCNGNGGVTAP